MSLRLLICDDDRDILEVCTTILENKGYEVSVAYNCDSIVEIVKVENPDIIFMDLWLPPLGGEPAIRELKAHPKLRSIPIVIFSANNNIEEIAKSCGADRFLKKPFDIDALENLVNELSFTIMNAQA